MTPLPQLLRRLSILALGLVTIGAAVNCRGAEPPEDADAPSDTAPAELTLTAEQIAHGAVQWTPATASTITEKVELPGVLKVNEDLTARVSAPGRGRLLEVRANTGDRVARGQVLAALQSEEASAARATHAKAAADLGHQQARLEFAKAARERSERLLALKSVPLQDVERARTEEKAASAAVAESQAELERAIAALALLDVDPATGRMLLTSPLTGVVLSRDASPGAVVEAGTTILVVTNPDSLWLQVAVPEQIAGRVVPGARIRFTVPAFPAETFDARVHSLATAVDPDTRAIPLRANVANPRRRLRPEMLATVQLETGVPRTGMAVPEGAVQQFEGRTVAFVATPDGRGGALFTRRDIEVLATADDRRRIIRGVKEGESIVTTGAFTIKSQFGRSRIEME